MIKNTKDEMMLILEELVVFCEKIDKKSMKDVYKSVKNDLNKKISTDEAKELYVYFCRYSSHVDPPDYEDIRVQKIINFFRNWQQEDMN